MTKPPLLSRPRKPGDGDTEIEVRLITVRGNVDVMDASSLAQGISRQELLNRIIQSYCDRYLAELTVAVGVLRNNPALLELLGRG